MNEIKTVIFSKNRAAQLDLLLRGITFPASVLYTYDKEFKAGYEKVISMYPNIIFAKEEEFKWQLINIIGLSKYVMFLADDDVLIDEFKEYCPEFDEFKKDESIISLSLSLCPRYRHRGLPVLTGNKWEWMPYKNRAKGYALRIWGFPMGLIGHIFRTKDVVPTLIPYNISIPNHLEGVLAANVPNKPLMMCFDSPKVINIQANQVQSIFPDRNYGVSPHELEKIFLRGERLSLDDIKQKAKTARSYHLITNYTYEYDTR